MNGVLVLIGSVVTIVGGLAALTRQIWKAAQEVHDNKRATMANTRALDKLQQLMETRIGLLEDRVYRMETYLRRGVRQGNGASW